MAMKYACAGFEYDFEGLVSTKIDFYLSDSAASPSALHQDGRRKKKGRKKKLVRFTVRKSIINFLG